MITDERVEKALDAVHLVTGIHAHKLSRYPSLVFVIDEAMPENTIKVDKDGIGRCNSAEWEKFKKMATYLNERYPLASLRPRR